MRKVPIFTLLALLLLAGGYFFYQHLSSKVDVTFTFLVTKKLEDHKINGTIDGAGDKIVILPLSKQQWKNVKAGQRYNVEANYYNKKQPAGKERDALKGPFWSNDANRGLLANKITIVKVENIETSME